MHNTRAVIQRVRTHNRFPAPEKLEGCERWGGEKCETSWAFIGVMKENQTAFNSVNMRDWAGSFADYQQCLFDPPPGFLSMTKNYITHGFLMKWYPGPDLNRHDAAIEGF